MIRHVVTFRWNDDVDAAHVAAVGAALDGLAASIPDIAGYSHGIDAGINDGNADYAVVADFDSVDRYLAYRDHPLHQQFIADFVAGKVASRAAVQFTH